MKHLDTKHTVIHQITNDVKEKDEAQCVTDLEKAVDLAKSSLPQSKVVVSLGTHREDRWKYKVNKVNGMIRNKYKNDPTVQLCHHDNLQEHGRAKPFLLASDNYRLTENGTKVIASNIRYAIEPWRKSMQQARTQRSDSVRPNYKPPNGENRSYSGIVSGYNQSSNPTQQTHGARPPRPQYDRDFPFHPVSVRQTHGHGPPRPQYDQDFPIHPVYENTSHDRDERPATNPHNFIITSL